MMGLWSVIGTFSKYSYHFTSNKCAALTKPGNGTYSPGNHTGIPIVPCWYNLKLTTKKNGSGQIFWHHKRYLSMLSIDTHRKEENSIKHLRLYHSTSVDDIPMVSASTMKKSLRSFRISFYDGFTCLIADCVLCSDCITSPTQTKLYINKTTGYFICQQCCSSGSWTELEKHLSKKKSSKPVDPKELDKIKEGLVEEANIAAEWKQIRKLTSPLTSLPEQDINVILKDLQLSLVSPVIGRFEPRINDTRSLLYFPLCSCDGQVAGYKVLHRETCLETTIPLTGCSGIVVAKQGKASRHEAVLVSSVSDALSLATQKMPYQIVCLPHGLTSLPQQVLPTLERFRKLILWFGNDVKSWDIARNFAKKLDEKRCYFVRPIESQPSPQAALALGQDLRAIVAAAQPIWHEAITEFSSLREDVLAELQNNDKVQGVKWKRFPALTRILKGHRRGEFTVLTGPTGSGKTTFMSEYSLDLASQGVNTLWGSFEIRNARLARTMLTQMAGIPLDKHLDQFDNFADQFEKLPLYFMTFHGQQSVKVVMDAVEHATYVHDIAHVIIDNVQFMMGVSEESKHMDRFWKQDAIIAHFRTFATKKNCHVSLVIHPRKERDAEDLTTNSIFGGAKAVQEADNVLIIQDKRLTSVRGKKYLQIAKNRYSGDLGVMPLEFDKDSISYGGRKKKSAVEGRPTDIDESLSCN